MPVQPQPAASVVLVREGDLGLEVFMMRRAATMAFVPGMFVFPGGRLDARDFHAGEHLVDYPFAEDASRASADEALLRALVACAIREVEEETSVRLTASDLSLLDHWVTPEASPQRFDVRFFVSDLPDGEIARATGTEMDAVTWIRPQDALDASATGDMHLLLPTQRVLALVAAQPSTTALVAAANQRDLFPKMPVRGHDDSAAWRIVHAGTGDVLETHDKLPERWEGIDVP